MDAMDILGAAQREVDHASTNTREAVPVDKNECAEVLADIGWGEAQ